MRKSQVLSNKLNLAESYIERARRLINQVVEADENGEGNSAFSLDNKLDEVIDLIGDLGYEIIMPLEMEEEETQ